MNVSGEDGEVVLPEDILQVSLTAENVADYEEALARYRKAGVVALAVDSLTALGELVMLKHVGEKRYPDPKKDGERAKMLWGLMSVELKNLTFAARAAVPLVFFVAPLDKAQTATGETLLAPDLTGKTATRAAGWFDLAGFMTASVLGPGRIKREVSFTPRNDASIRQRVRNVITKPIDIPEGSGGWANIYAACEAAMRKEGGTK